MGASSRGGLGLQQLACGAVALPPRLSEAGITAEAGLVAAAALAVGFAAAPRSQVGAGEVGAGAQGGGARGAQAHLGRCRLRRCRLALQRAKAGHRLLHLGSWQALPPFCVSAHSLRAAASVQQRSSSIAAAGRGGAGLQQVFACVDG